MSIQPALEAKNLSKTYGNVVALSGADLQLYPGEVLAVVGDNGAGKSRSSSAYLALRFQIVE